MSYVERRPVLVCTDEDVAITARARACDGEIVVTLTAAPATGGAPILDVQIPERVWRDWVRSIQRALRDEAAE